MKRKRHIRNHTRHNRSKKTPLEAVTASKTGQEKVSLLPAISKPDRINCLAPGTMVNVPTNFVMPGEYGTIEHYFNIIKRVSFVAKIIAAFKENIIRNKFNAGVSLLREYSLNLALAAVLLALFIFLGAMTYLSMSPKFQERSVLKIDGRIDPVPNRYAVGSGQ